MGEEGLGITTSLSSSDSFWNRAICRVCVPSCVNHGFEAISSLGIWIEGYISINLI